MLRTSKKEKLFFRGAAFILLGFAIFAATPFAKAQEAQVNADAPEAQSTTPEEAVGDKVSKLAPNEKKVDPLTIGPLVFTSWERAAINDARKARGLPGSLTLPPPPEKITPPEPGEEKPRPPPEEREITLGGILYVSINDWTIWLNGKRITPATVPLEARDLKVYEGYVELKWFDDYSKQIYPLRLRPHQRFNIDTHIFLPG